MNLAIVGEGVALSYDDFDRQVEIARAALDRFAPGTVLALRPGVDVRTAVWVMAAWQSHVTLWLMHPRVPERELERQRAVVGAALELGALPDASSDVASLEARRAPSERAPIDEVPFAIVFTSGTTGTPRGAVLSRRAFRIAAETSARNLGWRDDDRWLLSLPPAHVGGLSVLLRTFAARRTVVLAPPKLEVAALPTLVEAHRVTLLSLVPTVLHRLLASGWRAPSHVRAVLLGGAAASPSLLRHAREADVPVLTTYGMTETCAQVATRAPGDTRDAPDVGTFLGGVEACVRDGVLMLRGPQLFDGYVGEPSPFDAEGWFSTGDLAHLDEAGRLTLLGRRGDLIVRGGENVYPARVEATLLEDDRIDAVSVLGLTDDEWGERVAAALVAKDPDAALEALVTAPLATFERPSRVAFFDALPTNTTGKIDRAALRATAVWRPLD
ncbi:MAG: AMP-binding protein [Sandaracinus sp.]|nr:AMP-binding protein [Sandaracinus sp.]MCB9631030.1 AMP-binding protein [Sandaracinus sp.]